MAQVLVVCIPDHIVELQQQHIVMLWIAMMQACLPVKDLDLGYNLVRTHDGTGAFVIVDHDELDPITSKAPMSTVYASGMLLPSFHAFHTAKQLGGQILVA